MKNSSIELHIKHGLTAGTETKFNLQNKSTFTGFRSSGKFVCFAFENQTVVFQKPTNSRFYVSKLCKLNTYNFHNSKLKPINED